jgi:hypothetical protein
MLMNQAPAVNRFFSGVVRFMDISAQAAQLADDAQYGAIERFCCRGIQSGGSKVFSFKKIGTSIRSSAPRMETLQIPAGDRKSS